MNNALIWLRVLNRVELFLFYCVVCGAKWLTQSKDFVGDDVDDAPMHDKHNDLTCSGSHWRLHNAYDNAIVREACK